MQVLYGTPLPPGLMAPTQGELRLRVDQLLLDDDAINHNPLVQLFESDPTQSSSRRVSHADSPSASATSAPSRSPNRFVVPVDHCAVGPIFWGETRPTAQGQPSTPQVRRGPLTMAYPIKIDPVQFRAYLQRMTASPQGGVLLDVFVPSSYSGRPAVSIGKARLALDQLRPGHPVQGWVAVTHRRSRSSASAAHDGSDSAAGASSGTDGTPTPSLSASPLKEIPIGKVKVTVSVEYYPTLRHPTQDTAAEAEQARVRRPSSKHRRHPESSSVSSLPAHPHTKTRRSGEAGELAVWERNYYDPASRFSEENGSMEASLAQLNPSQRVRGRQSAAGLSADVSSVTEQLLQQGLRLRAQMEAATRGSLDALDGLSSATDPVKAARQRSSLLNGLPAGTVTAPDLTDESDVALPVADAAAEEDQTGTAEDATDYTSEASDEEKFALQLQRDSEARDSRVLQPFAGPSHEEQSQPLPHSPVTTSVEVSRAAATTAAATAAAPAAVELCFSRFSFAQTPATADLRQIRLNVRLSSDITTKEPSGGPLSSYVHAVPIQQPSVCLHFDVCSYSAEHSKLVVEAYKVTAETDVDDAATADAWDARGPRHVAREELLGLSVVGLYQQSREIVFRDPVMDSSNVYAQLEVRMQRTSSDAVTTTALEEAAVQVVAGQASRSATPASEAAPLSSIAVSSVQRGSQAFAHRPTPQKHEAVHQAPALTVKEAEAPGPRARFPAVNGVAVADTSAAVTAATQTAPQAEGSVVDRQRLRVVVHSAAELPRVALARSAAPSASRCPLVLSSPRVLPDAGVDAAQSYREPSSFVTVEEVFEAAHAPSPPAAGDGQSEGSVRSRACMRAIPGWCVEEARGGFYDRSAVVAHSVNPHYDYEAILQLPQLTRAAVEGSLGAAGRNVSVNESRYPRATADMLEELQLNVWHSDALQHPAAVSAGDGRRETPHLGEEEFWASAAYMGTCRIDLRPLRYLMLINGYYRVVCERTPNNAADQTQVDMEANTIGYVRVSVSFV